MFGLPLISAYGSPPYPGEVVGTDPWDDDDDATYASGSASADFHHIESVISPTAVDTAEQFVFRVSATKTADGIVRFVANLYPPGWTSAGQAGGDPTEPELNFTAGANGTYVTIPVTDGTVQDIPVTINVWVSGTPATAEQIETYFAAGGVLLIQPTSFGAGDVEVTIHRIRVPGVEVEPDAYRRIYPRDDGLGGGAPRTYPPSKSVQLGNRTTGGYL
jgi:hypothetical protein